MSFSTVHGIGALRAFGAFCVFSIGLLFTSSASGTPVFDDSVKTFQKISAGSGGLIGPLQDNDQFGFSVVPLGDLDRDGVPDLAVGSPTYTNQTTSVRTGAVFVLFMNADGTVKSERIVYGQSPIAWFGLSLATIKDLDGDNIPELAVGNPYDSNSGKTEGTVHILFLRRDGTVKRRVPINSTRGNFRGTLDTMDAFGTSIASLNDLNGDGISDLAVGAQGDDDGCPTVNPNCDKGGVWVLFLNRDGTVKDHQKISDTAGGFFGTVRADDGFGISVANLKDLNNDGVTDLAVGAFRTDDGGPQRGAVWILFLNRNGGVKGYQKISDTTPGFAGTLSDEDYFGYSVTRLEDLNGDGVQELVVGTHVTRGLDGEQTGAVWLIHLNPNGTVQSHYRISEGESGFYGDLNAGDSYGISVSRMDDLDGDGAEELVVGAIGDRSTCADVPGDCYTGAVWVLFMQGTTPAFASSGDIGRKAESIEAGLDTELPGSFALAQNYPNPFNPQTSIHFSLAEASEVRLAVYDLMGREIERLVDGSLAAGAHTVAFDGGSLPSGTYIYRLDAGASHSTRTMTLVK